jgi:maltooligosyltrehalose trehalohydrolase
VIQDVVYNHLGASGNYLPEFGPYLRADASNTWGAAVNLDGPESDEVRRYILDNARMWFEDYHVDGLRLDAVHALRDSRALTLLEELAVETDALGAALGRPLQLIAESDLNDPRLFTARGVGGLGLTASWNDDVHHAIHVAVTGETAGYYADFAPLSALTKVLQRGYFHDGTYSSFRGRTHGRPIDTVVTPPWRLITSIQTHDQVGNRAAGDRLAQQAGTRAQAVAAVLLFTAPFTPMLFMGEEWAASTPWPFFTSHPEPELAEKTRTGRLEEFSRHGWDASLVPDPQDPATFHGAKLNWSERSDGVHATMLALYRDLVRLRRSHPDVIGVPWTQTHIEADENARWIVIRRGGATVAANLALHKQAVSLGPAAGPASRSLAVATDREARLDPDAATVTLPPLSAVAVA